MNAAAAVRRIAPQLAAVPSGPPDLLHPTPVVRVDHEKTKLAVAIAFAGGNSGGLFAEALERAAVAPSKWSPRSFQQDLYLQHFVQNCFTAKVGNHRPVLCTTHLVQVLAHPPSDPAAVVYRREILAELSSSPNVRLSFERLYTHLCRFRGQLEGVVGVGKWDANRRQLDTLRVAKDLFDDMAAGFASCQSGLRTLATYAERVRRGEAFQSMCDLLRYDENLATLSLKVGVGADGRIRGFRVESVSENTGNPFVTSPWRRWWAKVELFLRGFDFGEWRGHGTPALRGLRRSPRRPRSARATPRRGRGLLGRPRLP